MAGRAKKHMGWSLSGSRDMQRADTKPFGYASVVLFFLVATISCGEDDSGVAPDLADAESGIAQALDAGDAGGASETAGDLIELRAEVQRLAAASPCPAEPCPLIKAAPAPAAPTSTSLGERILLIDDGLLVQAATRYPSRVLAYLRRLRDGSYAAFTPEVELPRDALYILSRIDAVPGEVPSQALDVVTDFSKFFTKMPDFGGHGMDMLPFLAERVPDAQFVISEDQLDYAVDCELLETTENSDPRGAWSRFLVELANTEQSLVRVVREHELNAIHLSWGLAHEVVSQDFLSGCGRASDLALSLRIQRAYVAMFQRLGEVRVRGAMGVERALVIFQAAWPTSAATHSQNLHDCADVPSRVRVGAVAGIPDPQVPCSGAMEHPYFGSAQRASNLCTDIAVVLGYRNLFEPVRAGAYWASIPFGFSGAQAQNWPASSSYAAPVGLAHYFYLQRLDPRASRDSLIAQLTRARTLPLIDPLLYRAFPDELRMNSGRNVCGN